MTDHTDVDMFQQTDHEEFAYQVTALVKDKSTTAANQAAARIDAVMRALANPTGYTLMLARRRKRIATTVPDDTTWTTCGRNAAACTTCTSNRRHKRRIAWQDDTAKTAR